MSSLAAVRKQLFIILLTSMRNVHKASSVNNLPLTIHFNAFFIVLTLKCTPPIHIADTGVNFCMIYL